MNAIVTTLVGWAGAHPHVAGALVAAIACAESLAFIGMFVPGAVMMLGAGALIGVGALEFWTTLAWAVGGAIVGDGVSYWIGHRYQASFMQLRFIRARPELMQRGAAFFQRYGGKSILLARFIGPLRPVVPVVAGALGMAPWRFYLFNTLSALTWAPAHLLPGMAFGASLALAGQVAGRLALLLGALVVAVWGVVWVARGVYRTAQPHLGTVGAVVRSWAHRHPRWAWLVGDLIDPQRPQSRPLLLWLVLLIAGGWLFLGVLEDVLHLDPLVYAGESVYHFLQHLRTPIGDRLMAMITELGDAAVAVPVVVAVLLWLLWKRAWRDALYWLAAIGFGALAVVVIKSALHFPRPVATYAGADAYSFPSGHTTLNTVIYGFLAALCSHTLQQRRRWLPYALAVVLVGAIAFSRLYLGAHWLADVAAGLGLGLAWVALLTIARSSHAQSPSDLRGLPWVAIAVFLTAAIWHLPRQVETDLQRYAVQVASQSLEAQTWWRSDWQRLPAYRIDLEGEKEQPLNVQWAGDLDALRRILMAHGWREPVALSPRTALNWFLPSPALDQLPALPKLHDGQYQALVLVRAAAAQDHATREIVLRLWSSGVTLAPGRQSLWLGTVAWQRLERLPLVSFPRGDAHYDAALRQLGSALTEVHHRTVTAVGDGSGSGSQRLIAAVAAVAVQ